MQYIAAFFEGIITFISPCLLPMLPIYISYFAGGGERTNRKTLTNAIGFVTGFTLVFVVLGALAGVLGGFLIEYRSIVNIVSGIIVIVFGLEYAGVLKLKLFKGKTGKVKTQNLGFFSSFVFGVIFSVGWTPCVGTFLGSALVMASQQGKITSGIIMLFVYSMGLGIPFIISALLIDSLKGAFNFIKSHYRVINIISGVFLIVVGILIATGYMGKLISFIS